MGRSIAKKTWNPLQQAFMAILPNDMYWTMEDISCPMILVSPFNREEKSSYD